ncbi:MAG TPA: exodeoxyribonuclease VII small subunit [Bacteroidales bacterium]|nr:exodeoxyribonuclease VII small subunit [Bacteroidales bacterium]
MSKEPTYAEAFTELQQIVNEIETGDVSVDILALKVKRAVQLIRICKLKLSSTEEEVNLILKELVQACLTDGV